MKLRQQKITRVEQMLNELERKVEENGIYRRAFSEQQDYITFSLEKDLRNLQAMIDMLREEIENEQKI